MKKRFTKEQSIRQDPVKAVVEDHALLEIVQRIIPNGRESAR
jgi:hypothetical protein